MMRKKLKMQGFNIRFIIFLSIFFISCTENRQKNTIQGDNQQIQSIAIGKRVFYDNCAFCHIPFEREIFFKDYLKKMNDKFGIKVTEKHILALESTLILTKEHESRFDTLSKTEMSSLLKYISSKNEYKIVQ